VDVLSPQSNPESSPQDSAACVGGGVAPAPHQISNNRARFTRRRAFWGVLRFAIWLGFWAWLCDESWLLLSPEASAGGAKWRSALWTGVPVGAFTSWLASALLGTLCGALWAWSIGPQSSAAVLSRSTARIKSWLRDGEPAVHQQRIARVATWVLCVLLFGALFIAAAPAVVLGVARPINVAFGLLGVVLGLALVSALLAPLLHRWSLFWLRLYARVPGISWLVGKTWRALAVLALKLTLAGVVVLALTWRVLSHLPWAAVVCSALAVSLSLVSVWIHMLLARRSKIFGYVLSVVFCAAWLSTAWVGFSVKQASVPTRLAMGEGLNLGRLGLLAVGAVLDVDGDGIAFGFGGGDCAPFDASRYPGAIDVPGNAIDENCDGEDLDPSLAGEFKGRIDFPTPQGFPKRPHVVLISVDALAPRYLAAFGAKPTGQTQDIAPQMSAFDAQSVSFHACFTQGPSTRLSLPALFTSRYDSEIARKLQGRFPYEIMPSNQMLAELMSERGYYTAAVLPESYFLPTNWRGLTQGFKYVDGAPSKLLKAGAAHNAAAVADAAIAVFARPPDAADPAGKQGGLVEARAPAAAASAWDHSRPLFLWTHFYDAHWPHEQPASGPKYGDTEEHRYQAEVTLVDTQVGRLLEAIKRELGPDTLVVLTADHGVGFDRPRHAKQGYGHDLSSAVLQVPMMWRHPSLKPHRELGLCSTLDILPTLANLLGLKLKGAPRGTSLVPGLKAEVSEPRVLFHQYFVPEQQVRRKEPLKLVSIRSERFNLVLDRDHGSISAWNWKQDFFEAEDLWPDGQSAEQAHELSRLRQILDLYTFRVRGR